MCAVGASRAQTTLEFWWKSDEVLTPYARKTVVLFEKLHPDVRVNLRIFSNEAYKTAIQIALASKNPPDVFYNWPGEDTGRFVRAGLVENLTPYAERDGWMQTLSAAALKAFTFNGALYGAPYQQESKYFYYNKDLFKREQLEPPSTIEELIDLCRTIRRRDLAPIAPIAFGNNERWPASHYLTILNQKFVGEELLESDYNLATAPGQLFADGGYEQALKSLKSLQDAGCFNEAINAVSPEIARALFYTDQTVMIYCGTWCIGILNGTGYEGQYGLFRMPDVTDGKGNQNYTVVGSTGLLMSSRSNHKETSAKFIRFWISGENQRRFAEEVGRIPAKAATVDGERVSEPVAWAARDIAVAEGSVLWLDVRLDARLADTYLNVVQEVLNGTKSVAEAMEIVRQGALDAQRRRHLQARGPRSN